MIMHCIIVWCCGVTESGDVLGWGNNEYGQLLTAADEPQLHTPRRLALPPTVGRIVDVAASGSACFVLNGASHDYVQSLYDFKYVTQYYY
jgi:hypothetical protein